MPELLPFLLNLFLCGLTTWYLLFEGLVTVVTTDVDPEYGVDGNGVVDTGKYLSLQLRHWSGISPTKHLQRK